MKITFHGHACFTIELADGTNLLIDPFITGNPLTDTNVEELKADYILITHGHHDHIGDMEAIAQKNQAKVIAIAEIANFAAAKGLKSHGMNLGGSYQFPFGRVKFVPALHSSSYQIDGMVTYMGEACGVIIEAEGKKVYHAGDTALFSDMKLLKEGQPIDLACLPIGDNFTMGPIDEIKAAEWLEAKQVVPIHYNTFPAIQQDAHAFAEQVAGACVLDAGETMSL